MAAPTFVSYTAVASFTTATSPKTASVAVQTGDIIVVGGVAEGADASLTIGDTVNTYTAQETVDSAAATESVAMGWTAVAATSTTLTITVTRSGTFREYGFGVWVWRSATVGAHASNGPNGGTAGAPSQAITTTGVSSALCIAVDDWNAADGTTRTWRTVNGSAATESSYARDAAAHTVYLGYHPDAGAVGSKTCGLSAPAGQKYSMMVIEVLGPVTAAVIPDVVVARFVQ